MFPVAQAFIIFQVKGTKKWFLKPPPECRWSCGRQILEVIVHPGKYKVQYRVFFLDILVLTRILTLKLGYHYNHSRFIFFTFNLEV
jgi:hypothetical protein